MNLKWFLSLAVFALCSTARAGALQLPMPTVERLPNGIELQLYPSDRVPLIDVVAVVRGGSRADLPGKSGSSELFAALIDRGAGGLSSLELNRKIEAIGANRLVSMDDDSFTLGLHGLSEDAPLLFELSSKILTTPNLSEIEFLHERGRALEQWKKLGDHGEELADFALHRLLYAGTPYARGGLDSTEELKRLKIADITEYYHRVFVPTRTTLIVIGKFNAANVREQVIKNFGSWTGAAAGANANAKKPSTIISESRRKPRVKPGDILLVDRPGYPQVYVRQGRLMPLVSAPDAAALAVVNAVLGEHFLSRLGGVVRDQTGLAYYSESTLAYSLDATRLQIRAGTQPEAVGKLIDKTLEVLRSIAQSDVQESELEQSKAYLRGSFARAVSTPALVASRRIADQVLGLSLDRLDKVPQELDAVSLAQARKAAHSYLDPQSFYTVVVGDAGPILQSLSPAQKKRVVRVKLDSLL